VTDDGGGRTSSRALAVQKTVECSARNHHSATDLDDFDWKRVGASVLVNRIPADVQSFRGFIQRVNERRKRDAITSRRSRRFVA